MRTGGRGNFLVIGFRELRQLEMDTIEAMSEIGLAVTPDKTGFRDRATLGLLDVSHLCRVKVSQFYGIEIDEAAAHIARVAMWITDHQLNLEAADQLNLSVSVKRINPRYGKDGRGGQKYGA